MKAKLYNDGELIGHTEVSAETSVIIYRNEHYVFNAAIPGYEYAKAEIVKRVEFIPVESKGIGLPFTPQVTILDFTCGYCNAEPGQPCIKRTSDKSPHMARIAKLNEVHGIQP